MRRRFDPSGPLRGILAYSDEELVSSDYIGNPHSCILDGKSTNVVDGTVAVVTPIGLDHAEYLGTDVLGIAREKAGIIKPGAVAVLAAQLQKVGPARQGAARRDDRIIHSEIQRQVERTAAALHHNAPRTPRRRIVGLADADACRITDGTVGSERRDKAWHAFRVCSVGGVDPAVRGGGRGCGIASPASGASRWSTSSSDSSLHCSRL